MSTPTSVINICSGVRLNPDYQHTIFFQNSADQLAYFTGKVTKTFSAYSYIRKHWDLKVQATMEQARKWSYLFFRNSEDGKYYFYFITNLEYLSPESVILKLELDVMQTYYFDYSLLPSFIERQHAVSDDIGENIVEEGLELGDFRVLDETELSLNDLCVLVLSTYNPINTGEQDTDTVLSANYDGVFSGLGVYAVNLADWQAWGVKLNLLDTYGKSDGIIAMWMYPKDLVELESGESWTAGGNVTKKVKGVGDAYKVVSRNTKLSGAYTPRNNKLFTYPYNFLYVTNNSGSAGVFRYERFGDQNACNFRCVGALSPEGSTHFYPINYNGVTHNYEEGLSLGNFPTCAWNQDIYKLWLAQNQNTHSLSMGMAALTIAGGVGAMIGTAGLGAVGGAGAVLSGASQIAEQLAQKRDMEVQPPQAKGNVSASVNVANDFQSFVLKKKSIGIEQAKVLDDYFDMYGYKMNRVAIPKRNARENWTYIKTIGSHITGNFCTEDQLKIESIYDKGVTFWVDGDSIGNYGLSNNTL